MTQSPLATRLGIVGTGRVARVLAAALAPCSAAPPLLWGRNPARVDEALQGNGGAVAAADLVALTSACDLIAIAVADDAIPLVTEAMASASLNHRPFIFHVSGSSGTAPLSGLQRGGALTAAIHPAMTFTGDTVVELERLPTAHFAVTGSSPAAITQGLALVQAIGATAVEISEAQRPLYHAALCHAANHLVTLIAGASEALATAGAPDPGAFLAPLARAALENSLARGMSALSGPILRGDASTVASHLRAIERDTPSLLQPYSAMARATLEALDRDGKKRANAELRSLLEQAPSAPERD